MPATLSTLFTPAQKERLVAAVRLRTSCRSFIPGLTQPQLAALAYQAGRFRLPGARLALVRADDTCFTDSLAGVKRITGCTLAAAVIAQEDAAHAALHAGIIGEALVLEATAMGLGACWVSGSLRRNLLPVPLQPDEELLCAIALGQPAAPLTAPAARQRKPPEQFCRGDWRAWPEQLLHAAALVQLAPSALNLQPWTLHVDASGSFVLDSPVHAALEAGAALCHAELALTTPHTWRFADAPGQPLAAAIAR